MTTLLFRLSLVMLASGGIAIATSRTHAPRAHARSYDAAGRSLLIAGGIALACSLVLVIVGAAL